MDSALFIFLMRKKIVFYRMIAIQSLVLVYLKNSYMVIPKLLLFIRILFSVGLKFGNYIA